MGTTKLSGTNSGRAGTPGRRRSRDNHTPTNQISPFRLTRWSNADLERFLRVRQEFFLDPMGSNKDRFVDAIILLQRALFDWYLQPPAKFEGVLSRITREIERWSNLKKEEQRTLSERRFALNSETPDIPAVESGVSASQWQRIFGSLGLGFHDPGTFDRFLVQLDVETNPSLRVNHRYMGELLPHDNMISYFSSTVATFLNENAIIGRVSPCVTHMEEAAARWLMTLVGWDGAFRLDDDGTERNVPCNVSRRSGLPISATTGGSATSQWRRSSLAERSPTSAPFSWPEMRCSTTFSGGTALSRHWDPLLRGSVSVRSGNTSA